MSVLITGASGLLGANMVMDFLHRDERIFAVSRRRPLFHPKVKSCLCDLADPKQVAGKLARVRPDWVVHCAAMTDVDGCESNEAEAFRANADATRNMARWAKKKGASFVYISTDSVFDGARGPYKEDDDPGPLNVYARSKLAGERAAREEFPGALIVRTNIFGWNARAKPTLAEWIVGKLKSGEAVPGFTDVTFNPILVNDLSGILIEMMSAELSGTYHVAGSQALSKFDFARLAAEVFGFDRDLLRPSTLAESVLKARRPLNTALNVAVIEEELGHAMPLPRAGLARMKDLADKGFVGELKKLLEEK